MLVRATHAFTDTSARETSCWVLEVAAPDSRPTFLDSHNHILTEHEPAWQVARSEIDRFVA